MGEVFTIFNNQCPLEKTGVLSEHVNKALL